MQALWRPIRSAVEAPIASLTSDREVPAAAPRHTFAIEPKVKSRFVKVRFSFRTTGAPALSTTKVHLAEHNAHGAELLRDSSIAKFRQVYTVGGASLPSGEWSFISSFVRIG